MLARVRSAAVLGVEAAAGSVEVDIAPGLPAFATVGLPDSAVRESRDRVRAAIRNAGFEFPVDRITVNLAPAELRKEGTMFDLPMALGILSATGLLKPGRLEESVVLGELSLDGHVRAARGVLPVALHCRRASVARPPAPALTRRVHRGHRSVERGRTPPRRARPGPSPCVSRTSPYRLGGGPDRGRPPAPSGRGEPRASGRALPRRAPVILPACAGGPPPTSRRWQRHDLKRGGQCGLPRALNDDRGRT